jgi:hypothetical protein
MGQSPSIADLAKRDQQFREYLKTIETDLETKSAEAKGKLQAEIDRFYKNNGYDDAKIMVTGQNAEFLHQQEFTLENLQKVIDQLSAAVFHGGVVPQGADVDDNTVKDAAKEIGAAAGAMANLELYVAGKVFDMLSSVVISFGATTSFSYASTIGTEPLAYGIQAFTAVSASSYESKSFFQNEYINEYIFLYDVRFSLKQAQSEAQMTLVQLYQNQLVAFSTKLNELLDDLIDDNIDIDQYKDAANKFEQMIASVKTKIEDLSSTEKVLSLS